jgi:hypothetical protein
MGTLTSRDITQYEDEGYLIMREAFPPERVKALRLAVIGMIDRALAGQCELKWIDRDKRLPARTGHMLHPDKYDPAWAEWLAEDLVFYIDALVGDTARHSLFGMLAGGGGQSYRQAWHRDVGKPGSPDEEEFLRRFHGHFVQFNAPLVQGDSFLQIVPASHLRASTDEELWTAKEGAKAETEDMPGAMVVEMEPGDIVFYNANLWHRGWNPAGKKRWTLHAAFWRAGYPVMSHEFGQREALSTEGHIERMPEETAEYVRRYLAKYPEGDPPSILDL